MTRLRTIATLAMMALGGAAAAQDRPVVIELFTSQGCSSCPPADALLAEVAERDDIIALALHVDYWDYIGWKDEFADPSFTQRQRAYARAKGDRAIYTPQMIIGGKDHIVGVKPMKLVDLVATHKATPTVATVDLRRSGDRVTVTVSPTGRSGKSGVVQLATYTPEASVDIRRGENAGRTLTYHNIVRDLDEIGNWDGRGTFKATVRVNPNVPVVAIVQEKSGGPIQGAARLR